MSDEDALLAAILAHPDEDTPRLAYADWLDEHADALPGRAPEEGHGRAEFIRLQIELARGGLDPQERTSAETRCAELQAAHGGSWLASLRAACGDGPRPGVQFHRGFVGHATGPLADVRWAAAVAETHPVERLTFLAREHLPPSPTHAALARCSALANVKRLDFDELSARVARDFLPSPYLTGLRSVRAYVMPAESMEVLARVPAAAGLRELWAGSDTSPAPPGSGLRKFLAARWPALVEVRLDDLRVTDDGLRELVTRAATHGWRRLHVSDDRITPDGVRDAIAAAVPGGPGGLGLAGFAPLRSAPELPPHVRELRVSALDGGDALAELIRQSVPPGRFTRLSVTNCRMSAAGAGVLSGWEGLAHLTELDLSNNQIGDTGAQHLARSPHLDRVGALRVASNHITEGGKNALTERFRLRVCIT
jgi:uncharacterized protein (TIGR02996 family)